MADLPSVMCNFMYNWRITFSTNCNGMKSFLNFSVFRTHRCKPIRQFRAKVTRMGLVWLSIHLIRRKSYLRSHTKLLWATVVEPLYTVPAPHELVGLFSVPHGHTVLQSYLSMILIPLELRQTFLQCCHFKQVTVVSRFSQSLLMFSSSLAKVGPPSKLQLDKTKLMCRILGI